MKFKVDDRVKIVKINNVDPSYLLNQVGTIVRIYKDNDHPYEIKYSDEDMKHVGEILWSEHELEFDKPIINQFTKLMSSDWEAWYLNGKLIAEGHSVRVERILDILADILPNKYEAIQISDELAEEGFNDNLSDMNVIVD